MGPAITGVPLSGLEKGSPCTIPRGAGSDGTSGLYSEGSFASENAQLE